MRPSFGLFLEDRGYWGSQGAGILAIATDIGKWLLGLRSKATTFEPGTWAGFGGKMDENDPKNTAKREFAEETGYQGNFHLHPAHVYKSPEKGENGEPKFVYYNFIGEIVKGHWEPKLNWETAEFSWVDYEGLQKIKPKHFGLIELLRNSDHIIRYLSKKHQP